MAVPNTFGGVYLNFLSGASATGAFAGWDFNPVGPDNLAFYWQSTPAASHGGVAAAAAGPFLDLAPGTTISGASLFTATTDGATGSPFRTVGTHILGVRFFNEATSAINFGYVTIMTGANGFPATIVSYSYENSGGAITIPVPEPATNALLAVAALALGALGVRAWRRQRAA